MASRVTFEEYFLGPRTRELWDGVTRLEDVAPGVRQVAVAGAQPERLDVLAGFPDVESVGGDGAATLRTPLPHVRELFVAWTDDDTLRNLPGLESLRVGWAFERGRPLDPTAVTAGLRELYCEVATFGSAEALARFAGLDKLALGGLHSGSAEPLAQLRELRWLSVGPGRGIHHLGALEKLELLRLKLEEGSLSNLKRLGGLARLRDLHVDGRGLKSIEGIGALRALERLRLYRTGVTDLGPLAGLPALAEVQLDHPDRVRDFAALGELPALRKLTIDLWTDTPGRIATVGWLRGSERLEELWLDGIEIEDGDLTPLFELPRLRAVAIMGDYGGQVEELRERRPDATVYWRAPIDQGQVTEINGVRVRRLETGDWSIFQDVTGMLDVDSNHDAEDMVRAAIAAEDAGLAERLTFDSEAGALGISSRSLTDVERAAQVVARLAALSRR